MKNDRIFKLSLTGMLISIGILIPMISPIKLILEPASFTLASHVAIFVAVFISPSVAFAVAAGTTIGFLFGGFPIIVVLRAASQTIYATVGAFYLHNMLKRPLTAVGARVFSLCINILHALGELIVVSFFYFGGNAGSLYYERGYLTTVLLLVGVGTVIHGMIDFEIARAVLLPIKRRGQFKALFHHC